MTKRWLSFLLVLTMLLTSVVGVSAEAATPKANDGFDSLITFTPASDYKIQKLTADYGIAIGQFAIDKRTKLTTGEVTMLNKFITELGGVVEKDDNVTIDNWSVTDTGVLWVDFNFEDASEFEGDLLSGGGLYELPFEFASDPTDQTYTSGGLNYIAKFGQAINKAYYVADVKGLTLWHNNGGWGKVGSDKINPATIEFKGLAQAQQVAVHAVDEFSQEYDTTAGEFVYAWASSNPDVVKVEPAIGNVTVATMTPVGVGNATVTVVVKNADGTSSKTGTFLVKVQEVAVNSLAVWLRDYFKYEDGRTVEACNEQMTDGLERKTSIKVGESIKAQALIEPAEATDKTVTWTSGNPSYIKVEAFEGPNGEHFAMLRAVGADDSAQRKPVGITVKAGSQEVTFYLNTLTDQAIEMGNAAPPFAVPAGYDNVDAASAAKITGEKKVALNTYTADHDIRYRLTYFSSVEEYKRYGGSTLTEFNTETAKNAQKYSGALSLDKSGVWVLDAVVYSDGIIKYGSPEAIRRFYVVDIPASGISVTATPSTVNGVGEVTLTANVLPAGADSAGIRWECDKDSGWSMISQNGNTLKIKTDGTVGSYKFTATLGAMSGSAVVKVSEQAISGVKLSASGLSVAVGEVGTLTATVTPSNASAKEVYFWAYCPEYGVSYAENSIPDNWPIWLNRTGAGTVEIVGRRIGTAYIYARTADGKVDTCTVTVTNGARKVATPAFSVSDGAEFTKDGDQVVISTVTNKAEIVYSVYDAAGQVVNGQDEVNAGARTVTLGHAVLAPNQKNTIVAYAVTSGYDRYTSNYATIEITSNWAATGVSLSVASPMVLKGKEPASITATVEPSQAKDKTITWKSGDEGIVKVTKVNEQNAKLVGVKEGNASVTVTTANGASTTLKVYVDPMDGEVQSLKVVRGASGNGTVGWTEQMRVEFYSGADQSGSRIYPIDDSVTWESNREQIATVDSNGLVTFRAAGDVQITATKRMKADNNTTIVLYHTADITAVVDNTKKVAPPVITAAGGKNIAGKYESEIEVSLFSATPGAKIYYELVDVGAASVTNPTNASTLYTGPFKLHEDKIVAAVAYDANNTKFYSATEVEEFNFDIKATAAAFTDSFITMYVGETHQLTPAITPSYAHVKNITWVSSDNSIATVDQNGLVTAIACPGEKLGQPTDAALITANIDGIAATCRVIVKDRKPTSITVNKSAMTMSVGDIRTLTATVKPNSLTTEEVIWTSSDNKIASISWDGEITAIKAGTVTITAKTGSLSDTCSLTVLPLGKAPDAPVKSVSFNPTTKTFAAVENGVVRQQIGQIEPGAGETWAQVAYYYNPVFTSSDIDAKFEIDETGMVTIVISDAGNKDTFFSYSWKLAYKPNLDAGVIPGFPGDIPNAAGETIKGNSLSIVARPTALAFEPYTVADLTMYNTETRTVEIGKITNYADFVATEVPVSAVSGGLNAARAIIAADGTVSVTITTPAIGTYAVATTISASGCAAVNAPAFNVNVTQDPTPRIPEIIIKSATKPYEVVKKKYTIHTLAKADQTVDFDVVGTSAAVTKWTSSKPKYLSINAATGEAELKKVGTGIIVTASLSDGSKLTKRVSIAHIASQIKLCYTQKGKCTNWPQEGLTIGIGSKKKVKAAVKVVEPSKGKMYGVKWEFSDPTVAHRKGSYIYGDKEGTTTVTVTLYNGVSVSGTLTVSADKGAIEAQEKIAKITKIEEIQEIEADDAPEEIQEAETPQENEKN